jgi:hypothetical protein
MSQLPITTVYQGDSLRLDFIVQDYDGAPLSLDGCNIRWGMADPTAIDSPILEKSDEDGITVLSASAGRLVVQIAAGELDTPGTYTHELEVTLPSGASHTYAQGPLIVKPTVYPQ